MVENKRKKKGRKVDSEGETWNAYPDGFDSLLAKTSQYPCVPAASLVLTYLQNNHETESNFSQYTGEMRQQPTRHHTCQSREQFVMRDAAQSIA